MEARKNVDNAKRELEKMATSVSSGGSGGTSGSENFNAAGRDVEAAARTLANALAHMRQVDDLLNERQEQYDRARMWKFGLGVTAVGGIAAGSHGLTGIGPVLSYRPAPNLELNAVLRWDHVNGKAGISGRGLIGYDDEHIGLFGGIGASNLGDNQFAIVLPLALRFRFGHELGCHHALIPFADLSVFAEPWLISGGSSPLSESAVFFGVAGTVGLAGVRGASDTQGYKWGEQDCD